MKNWILVFFLSLVATATAMPFTDSFSGMSLEIPPEFELSIVESKSKMDALDIAWWYSFSDENRNLITIEIEEYDHSQSLPEFFHRSMTCENNEEVDRVICEGLEFKNQWIGDIEFTKCQLRILGISDQLIEPLCLYDYLFVKGEYGFTISLMKRDEGEAMREETDAMMQTLLKSISFHP
ncbi:MAG: hypothetical protein K1000chlam2_00267 [Chlamydiae bacterium]|nr:hypothetical protein [Chlamydiota bacterium]